MLDRGGNMNSATLMGNDVVNGHVETHGSSLEQRVRHLEEAVGELGDTTKLEERVATRVVERVTRDAPVAIAQPLETPGFFARLPRALLPMTITTIEPPRGDAGSGGTQTGPRRAWALFDLFVELRAIWRMYVDPRYRLTWMGKVVPIILLTAIMTSWFWLPFALILDKGSGTLGTIYVKIADLVLAFFLYKALSREARRYRDFFPDPPPQGHS